MCIFCIAHGNSSFFFIPSSIVTTTTSSKNKISVRSACFISTAKCFSEDLILPISHQTVVSINTFSYTQLTKGYSYVGYNSRDRVESGWNSTYKFKRALKWLNVKSWLDFSHGTHKIEFIMEFPSRWSRFCPFDASNKCIVCAYIHNEY